MPGMSADDPKEVPGLAARMAAANILDAVLRSKRPLDEQLEAADLSELADREDRKSTRLNSSH